jgi:hypothetical protein
MNLIKKATFLLSFFGLLCVGLSAESLTTKELNRIGNEEHKVKKKSFSQTMKEIREDGSVIDVELYKTNKKQMKLAPVGQKFDPKALEAYRGETKRKTPFVRHTPIEKRLEDLDKQNGKAVPEKLSEKIKKSVVTPKVEQPRRVVNDIFKGKTITVKETPKRKHPSDNKSSKGKLWKKIKEKLAADKLKKKEAPKKETPKKTVTKSNPWDTLRDKLKTSSKKKETPKKATTKKSSSPNLWDKLKKKVTTKTTSKRTTPPRKTSTYKTEKSSSSPIKGLNMTPSVKSHKKTYPVKKTTTKKPIDKNKKSWWDKTKSKVTPKSTGTAKKKYIYKKETTKSTSGSPLKGLIYKKNTPPLKKVTPTKKKTVTPAKKRTGQSGRDKRDQPATNSKVFKSYLNKFHISSQPKEVKKFKKETPAKKAPPRKMIPRKKTKSNKPQKQRKRRTNKDEKPTTIKRLIF